MNNLDNKNFILAIVLSMLILIGWQYFYGGPLSPAPAPTTHHPNRHRNRDRRRHSSGHRPGNPAVAAR